MFGEKSLPLIPAIKESESCALIASLPQPYPPSDLWIDSSTVCPSVQWSRPSCCHFLGLSINASIIMNLGDVLGGKEDWGNGMMTSPLTRATPCISLSSQPNINFFPTAQKELLPSNFFSEPRSNFRLVLRQTCCIHFPFRLQK